MAAFSLLAVVLMLTLHLMGDSDIHRAISFELEEGNPLAWGVIVLLCVVVGLLARKLRAKGHVVRVWLLLLIVPGLLLVGLTPPTSDLHLSVFLLVCLLTWAWFGVTALDNESTFLTVLSGSMIAVPVVFLLSPGLGERALIVYALASCNLLYYLHLEDSQYHTLPWKTLDEPDPENASRSLAYVRPDLDPNVRRPAPATPAPRLCHEPDDD